MASPQGESPRGGRRRAAPRLTATKAGEVPSTKDKRATPQQQPPVGFPTDQTAFHRPFPQCTSSTSHLTISSTSSATVVRGAHPSSDLALAALPISRSTSAGR